jgi:hypothetical protein
MDIESAPGKHLSDAKPGPEQEAVLTPEEEAEKICQGLIEKNRETKEEEEEKTAEEKLYNQWVRMEEHERGKRAAVFQETSAGWSESEKSFLLGEVMQKASEIITKEKLKREASANEAISFDQDAIDTDIHQLQEELRNNPVFIMYFFVLTNSNKYIVEDNDIFNLQELSCVQGVPNNIRSFAQVIIHIYTGTRELGRENPLQNKVDQEVAKFRESNTGGGGGYTVETEKYNPKSFLGKLKNFLTFK